MAIHRRFRLHFLSRRVYALEVAQEEKKAAMNFLAPNGVLARVLLDDTERCHEKAIPCYVFSIAAMRASAYWSVVARPPRSPVTAFLSPITCRTAFSTRSAASV